jgi:predicted alpha-1,6-mannanase (GH76 family)
MSSSFVLHSLILGALLISNSSAQSYNATITAPTQWAEYALSNLGRWYNATTGLWESTGWWNCANIITTIGNHAKSDPHNANVQKSARKIFANAIRRAPAKNPQPGIENPVKAKLVSMKVNSPKTGYKKNFNPNTHEPYTTFPPDWFHHNNHIVDTNSLVTLAARLSDENPDDSFTPNPSDWLDGYYDDDLWWALAWITAYDVTNQNSYLKLAEGIFAAVATTWPTNCGNGGIYWSWEKTYVNAIANELFLSTAAHLANRASNKAYYLDWAQRSLAWFLNSGMINKRYTINDGLEKCANNNGTTWSYNQGVILGALAEIHRASPNDTSSLPLATNIARAALKELSDANGVIHDKCEPNCGADGTQFKGVFMRNLGELQSVTGDLGFKDAIRKNADSIWINDRRNGTFSVDWSKWVGTANASTHGSAMDALVAGIVVDGGYGSA